MKNERINNGVITIEYIFHPLVSDLVHEEVKSQMAELWMLFKNEGIWKEKIQLTATKMEVMVLIKYFDYLRERNFHFY